MPRWGKLLAMAAPWCEKLDENIITGLDSSVELLRSAGISIWGALWLAILWCWGSHWRGWVSNVLVEASLVAAATVWTRLVLLAVLEHDQRWVSADTVPLAYFRLARAVHLEYLSALGFLVLLHKLMPRWGKLLAMAAPWCEKLDENLVAGLDGSVELLSSAGISIWLTSWCLGGILLWCGFSGLEGILRVVQKALQSNLAAITTVWLASFSVFEQNQGWVSADTVSLAHLLVFSHSAVHACSTLVLRIGVGLLQLVEVWLQPLAVSAPWGVEHNQYLFVGSQLCLQLSRSQRCERFVFSGVIGYYTDHSERER